MVGCRYRMLAIWRYMSRSVTIDSDIHLYLRLWGKARLVTAFINNHITSDKVVHQRGSAVRVTEHIQHAWNDAILRCYALIEHQPVGIVGWRRQGTSLRHYYLPLAIIVVAGVKRAIIAHIRIISSILLSPYTTIAFLADNITLIVYIMNILKECTTNIEIRLGRIHGMTLEGTKVVRQAKECRVVAFAQYRRIHTVEHSDTLLYWREIPTSLSSVAIGHSVIIENNEWAIVGISVCLCRRLNSIAPTLEHHVYFRRIVHTTGHNRLGRIVFRHPWVDNHRNSVVSFGFTFGYAGVNGNYTHPRGVELSASKVGKVIDYTTQHITLAEGMEVRVITLL